MPKRILFFSLLFIMTYNLPGQSLNPDTLADKIIAAFQSRNFEHYRDLLINLRDYKELLKDQLKNNHLSEPQQKQFAEREKLFADSADLAYQSEFERLLKKGVKIGINWERIKKSKFIFQVEKPTNSSKRTLSGHLNFTCNDTAYVFFGIEAIELSSSYKLGNIRTVLKGGITLNVDPDLLEDDDK